MHQMHTTVTDGCSVCLSDCLSVTWALNTASLHESRSVQPLPNHFGLLFYMLTNTYRKNLIIIRTLV